MADGLTETSLKRSIEELSAAGSALERSEAGNGASRGKQDGEGEEDGGKGGGVGQNSASTATKAEEASDADRGGGEDGNEWKKKKKVRSRRLESTERYASRVSAARLPRDACLEARVCV